ncbi:MAG: methionine gamma-lyase family protein, partial [Clostridia bacterium]|nr:methionine gamma-lyase family protein [Clostridia bacterium]
MYKEFGISEKLEALANETENEVKEVFKKIDNNTIKNSIKVLKAFQNNRISDIHFNSTTGYGYGDIGRDTIENIFAEVLGAED